MNSLARSRRHLSLTLLIMLSLGMLATAGAVPRAPQHCPPTLAYKSCLGLMPPAYGQDPHAPSLQSVSGAPDVPFLNAAVSTPTGSWPQVLAAADVAAGGGTEAATLTERYFDPANDRQFHLFSMPSNIFVRSQQLPAGAAPEAATTLDVDIDGRPDLVAALAGEDMLAVFRSGETQPLSDALRLRAYGAPDALAVGDFDGDLRADLAATAPLSDTIRFWRSSPQGLVPLPLKLPYPSDGFDALATGDFDSDGDDDLAALRGSGYQSNAIVVYLQNWGTFPVSYTLSPQTGGFLPNSLAAGDLNGDGRDDLVVTAGGNAPDAYRNIFLQIVKDATAVPITYGLSATPSEQPVFHLPSAVAVADISHDGLDDLIVSHDAWRTVSVFTQNGDGSLTGYAADVPYSSRYRPNAMTIADFNGDGSLDVALVGREAGLTVLTNMFPAPTATITQPLEAALLQPGPLTIAGTASANANRVQIRLRGGGTDWVNAPVIAGFWQVNITLPPQDRAWVIEARAVDDSTGRYQAPPARRRVRVETFAYAVADNQGITSSPDRLMLVGTTTARATLLGDTGTQHIEAITFKPRTAQLYAADAKQLGTLDLVTGEFTPTSAPFGKGNGAKGKITFSDVDGMAFEPTTGVLYGIHRRSGSEKDVLFQIDPETGAHIPNAFGPGVDYKIISGMLDDIDEIAFEPATGDMYAASNNGGRNDKLMKIDKQTWTASVIGSFGVNDMEGLAFANDGRLYGTTGNDGGSTKNHLYLIDKMTGQATVVGPFNQGRDYEGIAFPPPNVLLPIPVTAPHVNSFTIGGEVASTTVPEVLLEANASGQPGNSTRWMLFIEYTYDQEMAQWVQVHPESLRSPNWQTYQGPSSQYDWRLAWGGGVKYLQAWTADMAGNISPFAYQAFINYTPPVDQVMQGQVRVYRYILRAGQRLEARIDSTSGDADLAIWSEDVDAAPWVSNLSEGTDAISFEAPIDGTYQIEVRGHTTAEYHLAIETGPSMSAAAITSAVDPAKSLPAQPAMPLDNAPSIRQVPAAPTALRLIYLPLVQH